VSKTTSPDFKPNISLTGVIDPGTGELGSGFGTTYQIWLLNVPADPVQAFPTQVDIALLAVGVVPTVVVVVVTVVVVFAGRAHLAKGRLAAVFVVVVFETAVLLEKVFGVKGDGDEQFILFSPPV